jgi:hypothetical protein
MSSPTGPAGGSLAGNYPNPTLDANSVGLPQIASSIKDAAANVPSLRTLGRNATQAVAGNDFRLNNSRAPSGSSGGDLQGAYPNPQIKDGIITPTKVNAAYVDGNAHFPSLRTLGQGALQACAGNDVRLSNSRSPSGAASGDLTGAYPFPVVGRLQGFELDLVTDPPVSNQVLGFNALGKIVPLTVSGGGGGVSVLNGVAPISASVSAGEGTISLTGIVAAANGGTGLPAPAAGNAGKVLAATAIGTYELLAVAGTGTVTSVTAGAGLSGGTIVGSGTISMPNVGTAATYGSASSVPVVTTDAQGRVSGVVNTAIAIAASAITSGALEAARGGTGLGAPAAGDAGKVVTAKADGTYELTTVSTGGGTGTVPAPGGPYSTLATRAAVAIGSGLLIEASSSLISTRCIGFYTGASTNLIVRDGPLDGFSGLTPGADYYLGVGGAITTSKTESTGTVSQYVGRAFSASMLFVDLGEPFYIP